MVWPYTPALLDLSALDFLPEFYHNCCRSGPMWAVNGKKRPHCSLVVVLWMQCSPVRQAQDPQAYFNVSAEAY